MIQTTKAYVREDEHGVIRVGRTRVMLDSLIAAFQHGHSPETIVQQYPSLTMEEVSGAIAYYLANREEVDRYLEHQDVVWNKWCEKSNQTASPVVARLRSRFRKAAESRADAE